MILKETVRLIEDFYDKQKDLVPEASKIVIGLGYTGIQLNTPSHGKVVGVAYTAPNIIKAQECSKINFPGRLTEKPFHKLLEWAYKPPGLKKIIGVATLNAASQHIIKIQNPYKDLQMDLLDYLNISADTHIIFIGLIKPMILQLNQKTDHIIIVENQLPFGSKFKQFETKRTIKEINQKEIDCDILFCTGTALINDTFESILEMFRHQAEFIAMIGPSVSMVPDILFESGVDLVGGMTIRNPQKTLRILQEAGGTRFFKKYGDKYNFIK
jgi:uncharacterized protein (DUF4213/DUF364 family)